ncbi:hypothetical protein OO25_19235 (plasmid) [Phaeobacter sp. S60]|nr:hypothetical protein OO25_19235 [Phaeobacter sp. S60]
MAYGRGRRRGGANLAAFTTARAVASLAGGQATANWRQFSSVGSLPACPLPRYGDLIRERIQIILMSILI